METRRLDIANLNERDIVSLLALYRGVSVLRPNWTDLRERMEIYDVWGFYAEGELIGFAWLRPARYVLSRTMQLVKLRYHWQYNTEESISHMIAEIQRVYREQCDYLLLDVDNRHEINLKLYRRLGFSRATMLSPMGGDYALYLADLRRTPAQAKELRHL